MLSCESTGRTIEKAIENALFELRAVREDVDIKILEEGGLFKKAKVLVSISEDCVDKYKKRESKNLAPEDKSDLEIDVKSILSGIGDKEGKKEEKIINTGKNNVHDKPKESMQIKKERKEEKLSKKRDEIKKEIEEKGEKKADSVKIDSSKEKMSGEEFIKELISVLNVNAQVNIDENDNYIKINIGGGNAGDLIGYRGECLNAIQYITSIVENERSGSRKKVILDIENYRARREDTLKNLAHRMENKVKKTNKSVRLEPMSANERRIIHTELQASESVATLSKGIDPNRFVVIVPKRDKNMAENMNNENTVDDDNKDVNFDLNNYYEDEGNN